MNQTAINPKFIKAFIVLWRCFVALVGLLTVAIICISLSVWQSGAEFDYRLGKMQWKTEVLPATDIMTIYLDKGNTEDFLKLDDEHSSLSGYHGIYPPKIFPTIMNQPIYLNQTQSLELLKPQITYRVNEVVLVETVPKNDTEYHKTFLKEATVQGIIDNEDSQKVLTTEHQELIGKRLITGVDYVARNPIFYRNLTIIVLLSKFFAVTLLALIGYSTIKFSKKLNIFEKIVLLLASSMVIYYIFYTSRSYLQLIT